jgi:hypothetical protein
MDFCSGPPMQFLSGVDIGVRTPQMGEQVSRVQAYGLIVVGNGPLLLPIFL